MYSWGWRDVCEIARYGIRIEDALRRIVIYYRLSASFNDKYCISQQDGGYFGYFVRFSGPLIHTQG